MSHYKVTAIHNNELVQVYPRSKETWDTDFDKVCMRIGMMVMSNGISEITVYRNGEVHRSVQVSAPCDVQEK